MNRPLGCLVLVGAFSLLWFPARAGADFIRFQNFDADPNWTTAGSGVNGNDFGFRTSAFAGGAPGEAGGRFTRSTFVRTYADTNLASPFNLDTPFSASGRFNFTNDNTPDFGPGLFVGHFDTSGPASIGMHFNNNNTGTLHWQAGIRFDDGGVLLGPPVLLLSNVARTWSYEWDPFGGGFGGGLLTVTLSGPGGATQALDLTPALRDRDVSIDAFGFNGEPAVSGQADRLADIFIDDVTYTVAAIPEPGSLVLFAAAGVCVTGYGWVRRNRIARRNQADRGLRGGHRFPAD